MSKWLIKVSIFITVIIMVIGCIEVKSNAYFNSNIWNGIMLIYLGIAFLTFIPVLKSILIKDNHLFNLNLDNIKDTDYSEKNKKKLLKCINEMEGTLKFWKGEAALYKRLHYYCAIWTTLITVLMPILIQSIQQAKNFLTIISAHSAIIVAFHKGFKVENNYKSYRMCESSFYDEYRKILQFNNNDKEDQVIDMFIEKVNNIRRVGRMIELDNMPSVSEDNENEKNISSPQ